MKKQDQLFHLIKSLTSKEKQRFRSEVADNNNYAKLFDAIEKQTNYNVDEIKDLFKNSNFIKQLHVTKNYLIKKILSNQFEENILLIAYFMVQYSPAVIEIICYVLVVYA